ncbi:hypothetical protein ACFW1A_00610 [Kitasatospora sp. NPDC058965]|uniref:hypothetical protein n=1 Tax=Kitasatospora sp. NPDC058965 TaxID=3346682 RepID=UPI0036BFD383
MTPDRRAVAALATGVLLVCASGPAYAGQGNGNGSSTPNSIESHVTITSSDTGSAAGAQHLMSVGSDWTPPPCWYEPAYTPDEFDTAFQQLLASLTGGMGEEAKAQYDKLKADQDFHRGQEGLWWAMVKSKKAWDLPNNSATCEQPPGIVWVPKNSPPPGMVAVTPEMLSKLAYASTKLPPPAVKLSPDAGSQTVNLPTYVTFNSPLQPVTVTAALNFEGLSIAASTLAVPVSLRVDAGTNDADPSSCTYQFAKTSSGYQVDSSGSSCNIDYRRSSRGGTYPLTAAVTWRVTWTPSTNPYAQPANPLPDGITGGVPQDVTVREIQTIVR